MHLNAPPAKLAHFTHEIRFLCCVRPILFYNAFMAFRQDEATREGTESAVHRFIGSLPPEDRKLSEQKLLDLIDKYGPVVDAYPSWHPLVSSNYDPQMPHTRPDSRCGYEGLDHTVLLRNGFITCPYGGDSNVIDSVENLEKRDHDWYTISAERLDFPLYYPSTTPVLVYCEWHHPTESDFTIPKRFAVARILEQEIPYWASAEVGETWNTMRTYLLGRPSGARSSLFVNQETGQAIKTVWNAVLNAGVFGPIKV
jgi:hypothetical protein